MNSLSIYTLADWKRDHPEWWFYCEACPKPWSMRLDPDEVIAEYGADYPMADYRASRSCGLCGARGYPKVRLICSGTGRPD